VRVQVQNGWRLSDADFVEQLPGALERRAG
jgi:hypothetical protein